MVLRQDHRNIRQDGSRRVTSSAADAVAAVGTVALTVYLHIIVPKGFFLYRIPAPSWGRQAPETVSFPAMSKLQQRLVQVIRQIRRSRISPSFIGADGVNTTMNSGRIQITLKPLDQRADTSAVDVIRRLQPKLQQVTGIELYMQPIQDLTVEDRISRIYHQYALDAPDKALLDLCSAPGGAHEGAAAIARCGERSTEQSFPAEVDIDRDTAGRLGITPQNVDDALYDNTRRACRCRARRHRR